MAFSASLSLSNLLAISITIIATSTIAKYITMLFFQSPTAKFAPASVDDITDGNLANVDISINSVGFIGSNAAIYVSKSF